MSVRVRFAPSPTGFLHIGSLRTALFTHLIARAAGGACILRIEDTDQQREVEGATERLIEILRWVGITFDEGPHIGGAYGPYIRDGAARQVQGTCGAAPGERGGVPLLLHGRAARRDAG